MHEKLNELQSVFNRQELGNQRKHILEQSQISINGVLNAKKMEVALNDWLTKVEGQIN